MITIIFVLIAVVCSGLRTAGNNEFVADYCSPRNTAAVNGIFSVLIFLSHSVQYVNVNGVLDAPYFSMRSFLGQLVVVTYLFFSGYGIMESIRKKGIPYVKAMPFHRLFKLWYHFAAMIVLFIITALITGRKLTLSKTLLAFTGYTSIGNSNWYIWVTFGLYIIVIAAFLIFRKSNPSAVAGVFFLTFLFVLAQQKLGLPSHFYNTIFCFPVGMLFSLVKPQIDDFMRTDVRWFIGLGGICAVFLLFSKTRAASLLHYNLFAVFFAVLIVYLMMKIEIKSTVLDWFGRHIFSFFMLQRIPMLILQHYGITRHPYTFLFCSFVATVVMAVVFDAVIEKTDSLIFKTQKP